MELLRKLRDQAKRYLVESSDWEKTHKNAKHPDDYVPILAEIKTFTDQIIQRSEQLLTSLEPLFDRLNRATNEQLEAAIELLSRQTQTDPRKVNALVRSFIGIAGNRNANNIRFKYEESVLNETKNNSNVETNFAILREKREWDDIDALITKSINPDQTIDLRNLLNLNDYQLQLLQAYMRKTNSTLFDLLFNPAVTIEYSPILVRSMAAREIGLEELGKFFAWIGERSIVLRATTNAEEERIKFETERYNQLIRDAEKVFAASVEREKQSRKTYDELKRQKVLLEERLRFLEHETNELKNSSKFLGDTKRIADYYTKLEQRYITNVVDHLSDIQNTELRTEQDLAPIKQLGFQTDQIQQLNDDYREYRIILYKYLRRLLL